MNSRTYVTIHDESGIEHNFYNDFDDMNLNIELLRGIYSFGYEKPSPFQQLSIVPISQQRNIIIQSSSCVGKNFCLYKTIQIIILTPTREYAINLFNLMRSLSKYLNINSCLCVGGSNIQETINNLRNGVQIVVGTPGRVFDMIRRGVICCETMKKLMFDEFDCMMGMGFGTEINQIVKYFSNANVILVCTPLSNDILNFANKFLENPIKIITRRPELTLDGVRQYYVNIPLLEYKCDVLLELLEVVSRIQVVVYCDKIQTIKDLQLLLQKKSYFISVLYSSLSTEERKESLNKFKSGSSNILLTTPQLYKVDSSMVSLVFNYDMDMTNEAYLERIGQSGCYGRKLMVVNFVLKEEFKKIKEFEKWFETRIKELTPSSDFFSNI
ncbi:RNA helicase [Entamoeba marina]